jgi:hypothetical protein
LNPFQKSKIRIKICKLLNQNEYFEEIVKKCCAAHIGMGGVKIKKEPRQRDEYVYRIS